MSGFRNIRLDIPADLHAKMVEYCTRQGVTQKDYLNGLLESDLVESVKREREADKARNQREVTKAEETVRLFREAAADLKAAIARLQKDLPNALGNVGADIQKKLLDAVAALDIPALLAAEKEVARARNEDLKRRLHEGFGNLQTLVAKDQAGARLEFLGCFDTIQKMIVLTRSRVRRLVLVTAVFVVAGQAAFAFFFPAAAPIRWAIVRAMGERTERDAAAVLAGSGVRYTGALMAETAGLLRTPTFAADYGECINRAKRTTSASTRCRLRMPALDDKP